MMHEVCVPCKCDDIEHCRMELYVSDVRLAEAELAAYKNPGAARPTTNKNHAAD